MIRELVMLGNPHLLERSEDIVEQELEDALRIAKDLKETLHAFRNERQWGRAISAPQIGELKKVIYLEFEKPEIFINPVLTELSENTYEMWDDCLSFPEILVKVLRHESCRITYRDQNWIEQTRVIDGAESELLQHEVDHLNGIVATMRAVDGSAFSLQSQRDLLGDAGFANPLV